MRMKWVRRKKRKVENKKIVNVVLSFCIFERSGMKREKILFLKIGVNFLSKLKFYFIFLLFLFCLKLQIVENGKKIIMNKVIYFYSIQNEIKSFLFIYFLFVFCTVLYQLFAFLHLFF